MATRSMVAVFAAATIGTFAACTTEDREVRTEPEMQSVEAAGQVEQTVSDELGLHPLRVHPPQEAIVGIPRDIRPFGIVHG